MERVMGIEPTQPAWKAGALPLSYTRIWVKMERKTRLELATFAMARRRSSQLSYSRKKAVRRKTQNGAGEET